MLELEFIVTSFAFFLLLLNPTPIFDMLDRIRLFWLFCSMWRCSCEDIERRDLSWVDGFGLWSVAVVLDEQGWTFSFIFEFSFEWDTWIKLCMFWLDDNNGCTYP